ncbi:hypothetical protein [Acinetobacter nosocomialis]|uniref:hypothetical protein n=1 Tax=Acinetobacter nosocomialis TaxID=106654 RepID=UPI001250C48F|nr:hypothetical protein [Acinetobacter nosocomialis]
MKYLTFKDVQQRLTTHKSFDMNDFIDAYSSKEIKIYLKHSGFIVRNSIDSNTNLIKGYYVDSVKPFRGLVEPLDDITNQDVVSLLQGKPITISYVTINDETYTLLRNLPTNLDFLDIEFYAQLYNSFDFLIEKEKFESIFNTDELIEARTEKSLTLENQKLLRIIGGMLAGMKNSERYKSLKQNTLYDLMAQSIDIEKAVLSRDTVEPIFAQANKSIKKYLFKNT